MNIVFHTHRLIFRHFENSDLNALSEICANPDVSQYVGDGKPLSWKVTQRWIENSLNNVKTYGYGTGAVVEKQSNKLIGWAGIARPENGSEEIIYGLDQPYWNQGFGTELLAGIVQWAIQELQLNELKATVHSENCASIRMLQKQQFQIEHSAFYDDTNILLYRLNPERN